MKILNKRHIILFLILNLVIAVSGQNTIYVKEGAVGTGASWTDAMGNLQSAINTAAQNAINNNITQVWVAAGTYYPTEKESSSDEQSASFVMKNNVEIYGGFAASGSPTFSDRDYTNNITILSGDIGVPDDDTDNAYRVIRNKYTETDPLNDTALLDGFTIEKSYVGETSTYIPGNVMYNYYASPTIKNCIISSDSTDSYIIYLKASNSVFENCTFENIDYSYALIETVGESGNTSTVKLNKCYFANNSSKYEMLDIEYGSTLYMDSCRFESNSSTCISIGQGTNCLIENSVFDNNHTEEFHAGAISIWNTGDDEDFYIIKNCVFNNNSSKAEGGALYLTGADSVDIYNCLFTNNYSENNKGGAIGIFSTDVNITNCTFYNNESRTYAQEGAAIFDDNKYGERLTINNSIIWGSQKNQLMYYDEEHFFYDGHAQPVVSNSLIRIADEEGVFPGSNNQMTDPLFADTLNSDFHLKASSPCLNTGANNLLPADMNIDLDGASRIYDNNIIDIGCYEYQGPANTSAIDNSIKKIALSLYPNPAEDILYIELTDYFVDSKVEIFNSNGKMVYTQHNNSQKCSINISNLASGIYLIKVGQRNGKLVTGKLLKH